MSNKNYRADESKAEKLDTEVPSSTESPAPEAEGPSVAATEEPTAPATPDPQDDESDDESDDEPEVELTVDEQRDQLRKMYEDLDKEEVRLADHITNTNTQIKNIRREKDRIAAKLQSYSPRLTQAEAHQHLVQTGFQQRLGRAQAQQALTGRLVSPSVLSPAEQARRSQNPPRG